MFRICIILFFIINTFAKTQYGNPFSGNFDSNLVKQHLLYFASDLFGGRGTGSIGENLASKYIAWHLNLLNIQPFGNENSYYQPVLLHGSLPEAVSYTHLTLPTIYSV